MTYIQTNQIVVLSYHDQDISVEDSGKIFITPQTAGNVDVTYTLPSLQEGLSFKFINGAALALSGRVIIDAPANSLFGSFICGPTGGIAFTAVDGDSQMLFESAESILGDTLTFTSEAEAYYIKGRSSVAGGIL